MPKWKEALACYNKLTDNTCTGIAKFYTELGNCYLLNKYHKTLTPEEFVSHFELEPTIAEELSAMRYEVGDTIDNNDCKRKILGVCGLIYFVSYSDKPGKSSNRVFTQKELDKLKYKKKS